MTIDKNVWGSKDYSTPEFSLFCCKLPLCFKYFALSLQGSQYEKYKLIKTARLSLL